VSKTSFGATPSLTVAQQAHHLRVLNLPGAKLRLHPHRLDFIYQARPTPLSRLYTLRLTYSLADLTEVRVQDPNLRLLAGDDRLLPHVYDGHHPAKLCLYLPNTNEWTRAMALATTVVPWSIEWLLHFEIWLTTNEWQGGGQHPDAGEKKQSRSQSVSKPGKQR